MTSSRKRRNWFPKTLFASASLPIILFLGIATAEETAPSAAAAKVKPDAAYKVDQLRLVPAQVEFSNPRDYRKILVLGKVQGAGEIDLTTGATLASADGCVKVDENGYLYPVKE
ncbi:MAG: hypothetical protein DMG24_18875, partial [Acidobacteria bacterium]